MKIIRKEKDDILYLKLIGRMDLEAYPELKKSIEWVMEHSTRRVLVNLKEIILISSSGVGALVNLGRDLEKAGGKLALVELSPISKQVIDFLRLDDVLKIFPDDATAIQFLTFTS